MLRPKVLFIVGHLPWPHVRSGNGQRTELILRALRQFADVDLFIVRVLPDTSQTTNQWGRIPESVKAELRICHVVEIDGWPELHSRLPGPFGRFSKTLQRFYRPYCAQPSALEWLRSPDTRRKYDLIVGRYLQPTMFAGAISQQLPVILDIDDVDFRRFNSNVTVHTWKGFNGWIGSKIVSAMLYMICRNASRRFSHIWVTNVRDRTIAGKKNKVSVLPNIPFVGPGQQIVPCRERDGAQPRILFVGTLNYGPNNQGIRLFLSNVWPAVLARLPAARLEIVGTGLTEDMTGFLKKFPQVEVTGFLENVREAYDRAHLTIAPVLWGAGTNIKVLESFAYGRVCIGTSYALGNFDIPMDLRKRISASGLDEMCDLIVNILNDAEKRRNVARRLLHWVNSNYSYELFQKVVKSTLLGVLENSGFTRRNES